MVIKTGEEYTHGFYAGADYGLDPTYGTEWSLGMGPQYRFPVSQFGFTTDPRTSNQLKAVSDKLSTGAKTVEVTGISPAEWESVPEQHLTEIYRLKKLVGTDITFHGPLLEPTGVGREGWSNAQREQVERQMWSAVSRAHKMDPKGNLIVTFHSSNGLPDPETVARTEVVDPKTGARKIKEQIQSFLIVEEATGRFDQLRPSPDYFRSKEGTLDTLEGQYQVLHDSIQKRNKSEWYRNLQHVSFNASNGSQIVSSALAGKREEEGAEMPKESLLPEVYKAYLRGEGEETLKKLGPLGAYEKERLNMMVRGDLYLRDAYQELQQLFNQAYGVARRNKLSEDLAKLDRFRDEIKQKVGDLEDPTKIADFAQEIVRGVNILRSIDPPGGWKPMRDFALDKASDTFSNVAFSAYKEFKSSAPIISIENPPAGLGLTRADDLRRLVEKSRDKLRDRFMGDLGLSKGEAQQQAEKLIGVTWDVGHINMIRKFGYDEADVVRETEKIAPYVKHVHLSDNFGMDHTELPMGMGNVPTKKMLALINKDVKKIVETGGPWFRDFRVTPMVQTLRAFGSPVYAMEMAPNWQYAANASGGYFAGFGTMLPEQHFSIYGSGFSNMPVELGGQLSGRSRAGGGTPME